jgi:hypothetical protein
MDKKKHLKEVGGEFFANTLSKPNFYSLCTTMELTLYDCSITSHNSADACSHLFLSSIRHKLESKLESKLETLDNQSPNQS